MTEVQRLDRVAVLVPAAGAGRRLGGTRKQFRTLGGRSILERTLQVFSAHPDVDYLVVAAPADEVEDVRRTLSRAELAGLHAVVAGGASRQASVARALAAVPSDVGYVLVHDAVRPFVTAGQVRRVIEAVRGHGAAALAVPATDTLRRGGGGRFAETVAREGLYRMQTPQGCRRDWFEEAHRAAEAAGVEATDDVDLVQRLGREVRIVPGSAFNLKITTPSDWVLAELLWAHRARLEDAGE